jgi:hypothetical protein
MFLTPFKIVVVVRFEQKLSAWLQHPDNRIKKRDLEKPTTMMLGFGPRIRAKQMKAIDTRRRQKPLESIQAFQAKDPNIFKTALLGTTANLSNTSQKPFNCQEVSIGIMFRHL